MKNFLKHSFFLAMIMVFNASFIPAQQSDTKFQIKFYAAKNSIAMQCQEGCPWSSLAIKTSSFYLNQFGVVNVGKDTDAFNNSDFIISVEKKGRKLKLVGIKGTQWRNLSFDFPSNIHSAIIVNDQGIAK